MLNSVEVFFFTLILFGFQGDNEKRRETENPAGSFDMLKCTKEKVFGYVAYCNKL